MQPEQQPEEGLEPDIQPVVTLQAGSMYSNIAAEGTMVGDRVLGPTVGVTLGARVLGRQLGTRDVVAVPGNGEVFKDGIVGSTDGEIEVVSTNGDRIILG
jgi:hypothetical protein